MVLLPGRRSLEQPARRLRPAAASESQQSCRWERQSAALACAPPAATTRASRRSRNCRCPPPHSDPRRHCSRASSPGQAGDRTSRVSSGSLGSGDEGGNGEIF
eukprot:2653299-Prymnesium_polylepis.1